MEVDFALLADAVQANQGKLYVIGGAFDTIWAGSVPHRQPTLGLAVRFLLTPAELGRVHGVEIILSDADGHQVNKLSTHLQVPLPPEGLKGRKAGALLAVTLTMVELPRFGDYQFDIMVNNTSLKQLQFRLVQHPASLARS